MKCPRCNLDVQSCSEVPQDTRDVLINNQAVDCIYTRVCESCMTFLKQCAATPSLIKNKMNPAELKKMMLWRARGDFVKGAIIAFKEKDYNESLAKYESYMEILEQTFEKPRAQFSTELFTTAGKADELSTYIMVLWDLLTIYDGKFPEKQAECAAKFVELVKVTPMVDTMSRKARVAARTAKNPKLYKQINKDLGGGKSCFVATAVFGNTYAPEVLVLREFRDQYLEKTFLGQVFIEAYYFAAPSLGRFITRKSFVAKFLRPILRQLTEFISFIFNL